jgi:protein SCO1
MRNFGPIAISIAVGLLFAACGRHPENPAASPRFDEVIGAPGARTFLVKGVVQDLPPNGRTAIVEHEAIPGFMEAMTMPIEVQDPSELESIAPGDEILFRLVVTEDDAWMDQVTRIGTAAIQSKPETGLRQVRWVDPLEVGDELPDYSLTNQLGQEFQLHSFRGQALALTFIFTRCPLPTFCPRMSNHFAEVAQALERDPDASTNWHLLTISFDPEYDTPSVLRQYSERYGANPDRWTFATGAMIEVDALTEQFGLTFGRSGAVFDHNLRTVVVDPDGKVRRIFIGNEWSADELTAELAAAARRQQR